MLLANYYLELPTIMDKYLRQTLAFIGNRTLRDKCNFCIAKVFC